MGSACSFPVSRQALAGRRLCAADDPRQVVHESEHRPFASIVAFHQTEPAAAPPHVFTAHLRRFQRYLIPRYLGGVACHDSAEPIVPRSLLRISSATKYASWLSRMIWGRMKMISSVRLIDLSVCVKSSPSTGIWSRTGIPLRPRFWVLLMRPARSTVWPLATATELCTLRVDTVGVSGFAEFGTGLLISCSISSRTLPLTLMRGTTLRMMPVLR